jgi:hypothetical protein
MTREERREMPPKVKPRKRSPRKKKVEEQPRSWYGLRKNNEEPLLTRAHKILIFILALGGVLGMGWRAVSNADARYAKEQEARAIHQELKTEVATLAATWQSESMERLIESKRDSIRNLNRRLRMNISEDEKFELREDIKQYENEVKDLQRKQEKLNQIQ